MKNIIATSLLLSLVPNAYSWDFGAKANIQTAKTDNVNSTNTNSSSTSPLSDTYRTFGGYIQAKNQFMKFKLKAKTEKYSKEKDNDNYSADLSAQYKETKESEFIFGVFTQKYNGATLTSSTATTTSDNSGARASATFSKEYDKTASGYFTISGNTKKYNKLSRTDNTIATSFGLEYNLSSTLMINPEIGISNVSSSQTSITTNPKSYYSNFSYGPSIVISFTPNDDWEFFIDGSYGYTKYSARDVTSIVKGKTQKTFQYQELISSDAGAIYSFANIFSLQAKYSMGKNTSNDHSSSSDPAYKANILSFDLNIKI